jgi:hypothetical protein
MIPDHPVFADGYVALSGLRGSNPYGVQECLNAFTTIRYGFTWSSDAEYDE